MNISFASCEHDVFYLDSSSNSPPIPQTTLSSHCRLPDVHHTACNLVFAIFYTRYIYRFDWFEHNRVK